ncbi:DUF4238 domain-containing protein [Vibrio crassostreae]|uniref:DUF4238 domain-containing protein n=1 Tax=Vibrio crassostreae TaxID=246167 RepID=UPI001404C2E7|nr:DUF4238 domain-containing protein [Vibrio crassostreae]
MASNKNQHYVPQCYLKKFSSDNNRSSISLFNIDRRQFIVRAAIKGQCSKNYFYGKDLKIEKELQSIEGNFSRVVDRILSPNYKLTCNDALFLLQYWLLQQQRTEATSRRSVEISSAFTEAAQISSQEYRLEMEEAVKDSFERFQLLKECLNDLKVCLIRNESGISFITSDDPAVEVNRLHILKTLACKEASGLASAGLIISLPLTPTVQFVAYDSDVYNLPSQDGWLKTKKDKDIDFFNQLQLLNCCANVFVSDEQQATYVDELFRLVHVNRLESKYRLTYANAELDNKGNERFRIVDKSTVNKQGKILLYQENLVPMPVFWATFINWKSKRTAYTNESRVGYMRHDHALLRNDLALKRVKL